MYEAKITECSCELTAKATLLLKDISNAKMLDKIIGENESITINPKMWAVLNVHNEESNGEKDYTKYIVIDVNGDKFVTGSNSFWESFREIFDALDGSGEEYAVSVTKYPSRNFSGKYFIKCSVVWLNISKFKV